MRAINHITCTAWEIGHTYLCNQNVCQLTEAYNKPVRSANPYHESSNVSCAGGGTLKRLATQSRIRGAAAPAHTSPLKKVTHRNASRTQARIEKGLEAKAGGIKADALVLPNARVEPYKLLFTPRLTFTLL